MKTVCLIVVILTTTGCNNLLNLANSNSPSFSYDYTEQGCPTGNHIFSSREQMCDGLRNDSLNNFCAVGLRHQRFQSDCSDRAW